MFSKMHQSLLYVLIADGMKVGRRIIPQWLWLCCYVSLARCGKEADTANQPKQAGGLFLFGKPPDQPLSFFQPKRKGHQSSQFHKEKGSVQCSWYPRTPRSFQSSQIPNVHNSFNVLHKVPDMNPQPEKHHPYPHFSPFTLAFARSANICRLPMFAGPALQNKTTKTILAHCGYRWYHIQVQSLH